jgi:hypothetical protein
LGAFEPKTVEMRVSGLGLVQAKFDEESKNISYKPATPLQPGSYTVIVTAKNGAQKVETRWAFSYAP